MNWILWLAGAVIVVPCVLYTASSLWAGWKLDRAIAKQGMRTWAAQEVDRALAEHGEDRPRLRVVRTDKD